MHGHTLMPLGEDGPDVLVRQGVFVAQIRGRDAGNEDDRIDESHSTTFRGLSIGAIS